VKSKNGEKACPEPVEWDKGESSGGKSFLSTGSKVLADFSPEGTRDRGQETRGKDKGKGGK
jgi:hypothetical protein